jgi:hypothetical protein
MKAKLLVVVVATLALVLGCLAGRHETSKACNRTFTQYTERMEANEIRRLILFLNAFRQGGESHGLATLERDLDGALVTFSNYGDRIPPEKRDEEVLRALKFARRYRMEHPWTNSDSLRRVEKALAVGAELDTPQR